MSTRRQLLQASLGAAAASFAGLPRAAEPVPAQLRIGFQKAAVNLVVLKQQAALEKRFAGSTVKWIEFPAGPQLLEALAVGSLEFGLTGDTPPVFAQAAGKELRYVGAEPPKPLSSAILVKPDAPLKALADLKGRKLALQKGSSAHYLAVRALDKAGLAWTDIQPVYLAPADARAAFERGSVDAWAIWDPYYASVELDLKPRVLANGRDLSSNNSFYLASRALAEQHPQAVLTLLAELSRADAWVQANRKEAAQLIADFSGLSLATTHQFISRRPVSPTAPLTPAIVADQQRVADAFARLNLIPQPVRVADIVWSPSSKAL